MAYARQIVDARKTALLGVLKLNAPKKASVELLVGALLDAVPSAARGKTIGDDTRGWRQVWPKPALWAAIAGKLPGPPGSALIVDASLATATAADGSRSVYVR
mmetsp:Transcript_33188/g.82605  ORF Transcript_33188/g.82605 Transcript_33188/m.82605 type:complete len:103 (+) Transcript_33188:1-309(+)